MMTLGQDRAWRAAMWRAVPRDARASCSTCAPAAASRSAGLRRPGRILLGVDASLRMLELAADEHGPWGWAPRLACADAFRLPFRDGALDAVTIAFGMRNLRPRAGALAELARVLAPGGTLVVLEATAPRPGPLAPLHAVLRAPRHPAPGPALARPRGLPLPERVHLRVRHGGGVRARSRGGWLRDRRASGVHVRCGPPVGRPEAGRPGRRHVAKRPVRGRRSGRFRSGRPSRGSRSGAGGRPLTRWSPPP